MAKDPRNLIVEHLVSIDQAIAVFGLEVKGMQSRLAAMEAQVAAADAQNVRQDVAIRHLTRRMVVIERRLDAPEPGA